MKSADPAISIVVPIYNEEGSIAPLYAELCDVLKPLGRPFEIIFIDDGSTDGTLGILKALPDTTILSFSRNWGKSKALERGFEEARGAFIITLDGDLQDDPKEIPRFIAALESGSDLVVGWKQVRHDTFERRFFSKVANGTARFLAGSGVHDMNCGFKAYRAAVAKELSLYGDMHRYIPAIVSLSGYTVTEIPVNHRPRRFGKSKYGPGRLLSGLFDLMTLLFMRRFLDRPMHFFGFLGSVLGVVGAGALAYLTCLKLFTGAAIGSRPLLLFGVLFVVVGFQFLSLGLLGELLIRQSSAPPVPLRFCRKA